MDGPRCDDFRTSVVPLPAFTLSGGWGILASALSLHCPSQSVTETAVLFVAFFGLPGGFSAATQEVEVSPTRHPGAKEAVKGEGPVARPGGGAHACAEVAAETEVNGEDLQAYCRVHVAGYRALRCVGFVDRWPPTASQRIQLEFKGRATGRVMPSDMAGGAMNA